jgi:hypothetical protein
VRGTNERPGTRPIKEGTARGDNRSRAGGGAGCLAAIRFSQPSRVTGMVGRQYSRVLDTQIPNPIGSWRGPLPPRIGRARRFAARRSDRYAQPTERWDRSRGARRSRCLLAIGVSTESQPWLGAGRSQQRMWVRPGWRPAAQRGVVPPTTRPAKWTVRARSTRRSCRCFL